MNTHRPPGQGQHEDEEYPPTGVPRRLTCYNLAVHNAQAHGIYLPSLTWEPWESWSIVNTVISAPHAATSAPMTCWPCKLGPCYDCNSSNSDNYSDNNSHNRDEHAVLCQACGFWLNGPVEWEDHVVGKKHRRRMNVFIMYWERGWV